MDLWSCGEKTTDSVAVGHLASAVTEKHRTTTDYTKRFSNNLQLAIFPQLLRSEESQMSGCNS